MGKYVVTNDDASKVPTGKREVPVSIGGSTRKRKNRVRFGGVDVLNAVKPPNTRTMKHTNSPSTEISQRVFLCNSPNARYGGLQKLRYGCNGAV